MAPEYALESLPAAVALPPEDAPTFLENALIKARSACVLMQKPCLADDSGLVVPVLGGAPGIRSARFAGPQASDAENIEQLLKAMVSFQGSDRKAFFYCVLVFIRHPEDPTPLIAEGYWSGVLLEAPSGTGGFGYDPIVYIPELGRSVASLDPKEKNAWSHRALACRTLKSCLGRLWTK